MYKDFSFHCNPATTSQHIQNQLKSVADHLPHFFCICHTENGEDVA